MGCVSLEDEVMLVTEDKASPAGTGVPALEICNLAARSGAAALDLPLQVLEQGQQGRLAVDSLLRWQGLERLQRHPEMTIKASHGCSLRVGVRNLDGAAMPMAQGRDVEHGVEPVDVARALKQPRKLFAAGLDLA